MHIRLFTLLFSLFWIADSAVCQTTEIDSIVREGRLLYKTELASWYGSDLFVEKYPELRGRAGGYFSYPESENTICIFYSNERKPVVLVSISFDSTFNKSTAVINSTQRNMTGNETDLYNMRVKAMAIASKDTFFKSYTNSKLNLIPLNNGNHKRVYFLTGPSQSGVVIFGNDYLIRFDDAYNATEIKNLHASILPFYYKEEDVGSLHTHSAQTGDNITATDICTLLLYERFTPWKQHIVLSENLATIWDIATEKITIMSRKEWDELSKLND